MAMMKAIACDPRRFLLLKFHLCNKQRRSCPWMTCLPYCIRRSSRRMDGAPKIRLVSWRVSRAVPTRASTLVTLLIAVTVPRRYKLSWARSVTTYAEPLTQPCEVQILLLRGSIRRFPKRRRRGEIVVDNDDSSRRQRRLLKTWLAPARLSRRRESRCSTRQEQMVACPSSPQVSGVDTRSASGMKSVQVTSCQKGKRQPEVVAPSSKSVPDQANDNDKVPAGVTGCPDMIAQPPLGIKTPCAALDPKSGKQHSRLSIIPKSTRESREYLAKHGPLQRRHRHHRMDDVAHDAACRSNELRARLAANQRSKTIANASGAGDRSTGAASSRNRGDDSTVRVRVPSSFAVVTLFELARATRRIS